MLKAYLIIVTLGITSCIFEDNESVSSPSINETKIDTLRLVDTLISYDTLYEGTIHHADTLFNNYYDLNFDLWNIHTNIRLMEPNDVSAINVTIQFSEENNHDTTFVDTLYLIDLENNQATLLFDSLIVSEDLQFLGWSVRYRATEPILLSYPRYLTRNKNFKFDAWRYEKLEVDSTHIFLEMYKLLFETDLTDLKVNCGYEPGISMAFYVSNADSVKISWGGDYKKDTLGIFSSECLLRQPEGIFSEGFAYRKLARWNHRRLSSIYTVRGIEEYILEPIMNLDKNQSVEFNINIDYVERYFVEASHDNITFSTLYNMDFPEGEFSTVYPTRYYDMVLK